VLKYKVYKINYFIFVPCLYKINVMEKTLTPEESLQIIQKSVLNSRRNLRAGSTHYLLWGWVMMLGGFANYFIIRHLLGIEKYESIRIMSMLTWGGFVIVGMIIEFIVLPRSGMRERVITHLDRYIRIVWITAGALMALMVFLSLKVEAYPTAFILGVIAMATAVSGLMVRFRPLVVGGFVFLAAAIVAIYLDGLNQLLVFSAAMMLGYLIPGYILRYSKDSDDV
jgi:hypothetical protein